MENQFDCCSCFSPSKHEPVVIAVDPDLLDDEDLVYDPDGMFQIWFDHTAAEYKRGYDCIAEMKGDFESTKESLPSELPMSAATTKISWWDELYINIERDNLPVAVKSPIRTKVKSPRFSMKSIEQTAIGILSPIAVAADSIFKMATSSPSPDKDNQEYMKCEPVASDTPVAIASEIEKDSYNEFDETAMKEILKLNMVTTKTLSSEPFFDTFFATESMIVIFSIFAFMILCSFNIHSNEISNLFHVETSYEENLVSNVSSSAVTVAEELVANAIKDCTYFSFSSSELEDVLLSY